MPSRALSFVRRLTRFRLRTLLLAMLVISVVLGVYVNRVRSRQAAVAAIERLGGLTYYDYELKDGSYDPEGQSWAPAWLRDKLGDDYFHAVVHVTMDPGSDWPTDHRQRAVRADEFFPTILAAAARVADSERTCVG